MAIATAMPLTHALALLRYGLVDPFVQGPHEIWVLAAFAVALTALSVRGRSVGQLRCLFAS